MEPTVQPQVEPQPKRKNTLLIIVAVIVLIIIAFLWWSQMNVLEQNEEQTGADAQSGALSQTPTPLEDTTPVISQDLQGISDIDLEKEMQQINVDVNAL
jgi:cytoskeletal protein RodZ